MKQRNSRASSASDAADLIDTAPRAPGKSSRVAELPPGQPGARTPIQRAGTPHTEAPLQRRATTSLDANSAHLPAAGPGRPMPAAVQAKMEQSMGADFSAVRIHEGPRASALGAHAYTQGSDIHFSPGAYQPGSRSGQELLGHELAHVVQQSQARVTPTTQAKGVAVNDDDALEREADEMGARAARGEPAGTGADSVALARPGAQPIQRVRILDNFGTEHETEEMTPDERLAFARQAVALNRNDILEALQRYHADEFDAQLIDELHTEYHDAMTQDSRPAEQQSSLIELSNGEDQHKTAPSTDQREKRKEKAKAESSSSSAKAGESGESSQKQQLVQVVAKAIERVTALRSGVQQQIDDGVDPVVISQGYTVAAQEWLQWVISEGVRIYGDPRIPAFEVLGLGSFARGEMAPHSDVDIVFILSDALDGDQEKAFVELRDFLGNNLFGKLNDQDGGITIDDVTGSSSTPESFTSSRMSGRDARKVMSHGDGTLGQEVDAKYDENGVHQNALLKVQQNRDFGWYKIEGILSGKRTSIDIKKDLLAFVNVAMNILADHHASKGNDIPLHTVDRLGAASGWGHKQLGKAMTSTPGRFSKRKGTLASRMQAHYKTLLGWRQRLHTERGKEDDHFTPSKEEMALLTVMFKDFKEFNDALAKDMPSLPK